ncbi:head completion/stabilization protein [Halomonas denitrificans]|uniref:head completion/stabilization protein n=1 Tax=Halomonas denitrificans TaxID=370769 RepID=UPI001C99EFE8|nr:head completion/stabilization protein [Halomonas denitrificans]MBY5969924.1 head completion/stabilization protein [Halomonas denitrificans]
MSLIAYNVPTSETPAESIENNGFWPSLDPQDYRSAERVDGSITDARVAMALRVAMADINRQLADWQQDRQASGSSTITDVEAPGWMPPDSYALLYRRAIYATATASLMERYRDHSATGEGDERGEAKDLAADDYRRDARWAVSEILGKAHTTVELI